ncbi:MAG: hypothetical protein AAFZ07_10480 [Actinomycetota bacterium]
MRLAVAGQRVVDEELAAAAADPRGGGLSERHAAAVGLAEAMMTRPVDLDDDLLDRLRRELSAAELVELSLDVMKWNAQKAPVALGVDVEVNEGELTDLVFDDDGNWVS